MATGTDDRGTNSFEPGMTRRAEYAEATRRAILGAARALFCEKGFSGTKVDDIAAQARVSPATVYAVFGGKQELLWTVMEIWTTAPVIVATLEGVAALNDPSLVIGLLARSCRLMREEFGDIVRLMLRTAPCDPTAAQMLAAATQQYRHALTPFARRLEELGVLKGEGPIRQAVDILWFYFGYSGFFALVDENHWSYTRAEKWLAAEALRAVASSGAGQARDGG